MIEKYWMSFLREVDTWLRLYGLAPWYFRKLKGAKTDGSVKGQGNDGASKKKKKYLHAADVSRSLRDGPHGTLFETYVPVVPAFGTGQIETYVKNGQQEFQWRWLESANLSHGHASMIDKKVHFIIETGSAPDIRGEYRSDLASLAQDDALVQTMRLNMLEAQHATLHPLHTVEWAPDIAKATGPAGQYAEGNPLMGGGQVAFPSEIPHQRQGPSPLSRVQEERRQHSGGYAKSGNGYAFTAEADYLPPELLGELTTWRAGTYRVDGGMGSGSNLRTQLQDRRELLKEHPQLRGHLASPGEFLRGGPPGRPDLPPNTHILEPYERMVTHAPAQPDMGHLMSVQNRFDQMIGMLVDYPLEIVMGMGGKGGGGGAGPGGAQANSRPQSSSSGGGGGPQRMPEKSGMFQYVITRQRARSNFFTKQIRRIFMLAYGATLQHAQSESASLFASVHGRWPNEREQLELNHRLDIHVFFPRTPLLSFDEMVVYYQHGLFSEEDFRKFALDVIGMEDRAPTEDYKKALQMLYKEPLALELKKMRAEATVASMTPQQGQAGPASSKNKSKTNTSASTTGGTKKRARESNSGNSKSKSGNDGSSMTKKAKK